MIRVAYGPRVRLQVVFDGEVSRTKQSFKAECDINNILRKFQKTGILEHARRHGAEYGIAPAIDFKEAMDIVAKGKSMWEDLPSSLKKRFRSPEAFVEFVQDRENLDEMRELGLAVKASPGEPEAARAADRAKPDVEAPKEPERKPEGVKKAAKPPAQGPT